MNRSESKYFCTARKMDEALLTLLDKKDFEYITVKEICRTAEVNRSTFYLHYETLNDLLQECAEYIIYQFIQYMPHDTEQFLKKIQTCPTKDLYLITPEYLNPYLNYIKEHKNIFLTAIAHASSLQMNEAYEKLNCHVLTPILNRLNVPASEQKYILKFHIGGIMAIIKEWIKTDCLDSVNHIAEVIQLCIKRN